MKFLPNLIYNLQHCFRLFFSLKNFLNHILPFLVCVHNQDTLTAGFPVSLVINLNKGGHRVRGPYTNQFVVGFKKQHQQHRHNSVGLLTVHWCAIFSVRAVDSSSLPSSTVLLTLRRWREQRAQKLCCV